MKALESGGGGGKGLGILALSPGVWGYVPGVHIPVITSLVVLSHAATLLTRKYSSR